MSARRASTRVLSMLLVLCMVIGLMPMAAFAAETDTLAASLEEAKAFIDGITINNSSNDPEKVVKNFKTHFTWDNEKRESSKTYLFDWSYYNGVVFEGIEYLYEVTGDTKYKDYVVEYMSSLIASNGTWAKCTNSGYTSKECAGYDATHGADCYKTASLLLDAYEMTGDNRYLTMANTLYADLDSAAKSYSLKNAGNNFRHTWASDPSPDLWLDGLYMILPFRAEYAKYIGDTEELDLIVDRMQWVSDNMYDEDSGLFYHAADNAKSNSGTYWLRAMGWYGAAIVDVMDSMSGDNFTAMQKQLVKFVDGMKKNQNPSNGMWRNNVDVVTRASNPYETSGTALVCYAVMKAVNNGWLDASYADMALLAFNGIVREKLDGDTLTDICFKGTPGSGNEQFEDNEGKGVGPFIMFYAEVLEYYNKEVVSISVTAPTKTEYEVGEELDLDGMTVSATTRGGRTYAVTNYTVSEVDMTTAGTKTVTVTYGDLTASFEITVVEPETEAPTEPEETEPEVTEPVKEEVEVEVGEETIKVTVENVANVVVEAVSEEDKAIVEENNFENVLVFDMTADLTEGETATISIPVPAGWDANHTVGVSIENGVMKLVPGTYDAETNVFSFTVNHFSAKGIAQLAAVGTGSVTGRGNLVGGKIYTLDTNGVNTNNDYLIVNTRNNGTAYALTNNNGNVGRTEVTVSNDTTITVENDTNIAWDFNGSTSGTVGNNGRYVYPNNGSLSLNTSGTNLTISSQGNGAYRIYRYSSNYYYYLRYYNNSWTGSRTDRQNNVGSVYLYELTGSSNGEAVTFTVTPGSVTMAAKEKIELNGTVEVGNTTYKLSDLNPGDLTWASSNASRVTVSNGTVTGVADGTANITATLSAVKGKALKGNIVLTIPVTVQSKTLDDSFTPVLTGNTPVTTRLNVEPDFSNIKLEVKFEGDEDTSIITVDNGLVIEGYDITTIGYVYATISYMGEEYGTVRVTVEGNPYEGKEDATVYPEYPADGAVRINKTATQNATTFKETGVTHVELDVAGISVKQGVDVVLIVDVSNSMGWSLVNANASADSDRIADAGQTNKLKIAMDSASQFADILLGDNNGTAMDNTLSFVTFAGYDTTFGNDSRDKGVVVDSLMEVFRRETSASAAKVSFAGTEFETGISTYHLTITGTNGIAIEDGSNRGDTNYDYAFWQATQTVEKIKDYNNRNGQSGREVYVIFMTDGAPSHYNHNNKQGATGRDDLFPDGSGGTYQVDNNYDTNQTTWYNYFSGNANTYAKTLYNAVDGNFMAIGFDLAHGGYTVGGTMWQWTQDQLVASLSQVAHDENLIDVYATGDADELQEIYESLATKIKYAGTNATATDIISSDFTLQMAANSGSGDATANLENFGITPAITIKTYDLYPKGSTDDDGNDITGKRTGAVSEIETVTFNDAGTEAYSNLIGDGKTNILKTASDGTVTIEAFYFTYTKTPEGVESFNWAIGNITDKEIALAFDAYLKGALEGLADEGTYYTNEEAILEYVDINGKHASQIFPKPTAGWGGASTTIRFYLVNEFGQPVNRSGQVVPIANAIFVGDPVGVKLNLNADATIDAQVVQAVAYVPDEYYLYDINASYTVQTASGQGNTITGGITPSEPSQDAFKTAGGKKQDGTQTTVVLSHEETYYTWSYVGFGVRWDLSVEKAEEPLVGDKLVIDYGKAVQVDVLANDPVIEGYNRSLTGFVVYNANANIANKQQNPGASFFNATNGNFSIVEVRAGGQTVQKVQFQPTKMLSEVQKVFYVVKYESSTNEDDYYYLWGQLDVIPATIMYYETDFATGVFDVENTNNPNLDDKVHPLVPWSSTTPDATHDNLQQYVEIGKDLYGYDSSYADDNLLSNGSSLFVKGQGVNNTTAKFSFTGTGFDLISRTGTEQGVIRVDIYSDNARTNRVKSITVLNKSESNLELYQIPVVSAVMDAHGTYYVTIHVGEAYTNDKYEDLNRGGEFYFDAIRVFNPIDTSSVTKGSDTEIAYNAYVADGEQNPQIIEVRNELIKAEEFESSEVVGGVLFVDRDQGNVDVKTYKTIGPNNEVYLVGDQAIAFNFVTGDVAPKSIHIGAKSANGEKVVLKAVFINVATGDQVETTTTDINTSTIQFITLFGLDDVITANTQYRVLISNKGAGVLSITDLKIAGSEASKIIVPSSDAELLDTIRNLSEIGSAETEEEEMEVPNFGVISAEFNNDNAKRGDTVTMVITTTEDVASVGVKNSKGADETVKVESVKVVDGMKVWTVTFKVNAAGNLTYTAVGYTADGALGTTANSAIKVTIR